MTSVYQRCGRCCPRLPRTTALASFLLVATTSLAAHDLWIEPTTFAPAGGKVIGIGLRVGQDFLGDPVPRDPSLIDRFIAVTDRGAAEVIGRDGMDPAGLVRAEGRGVLVIGYLSKPHPIVLAPAKFDEYLAEEGLDAAAALRRQRGETGAAAREVFSRCAKSLIPVGPIAVTDGDRVLGFPLEIVAERNPYALTRGDDLPVRVVYRGRPLEGVLVVAVRKGRGTKLTVRSGRDGRAIFRLDEPGMWLIKAVHMVPAGAETGAEWASFWASLTFERPQPIASR